MFGVQKLRKYISSAKMAIFLARRQPKNLLCNNTEWKRWQQRKYAESAENKRKPHDRHLKTLRFDGQNHTTTDVPFHSMGHVSTATKITYYYYYYGKK